VIGIVYKVAGTGPVSVPRPRLVAALAAQELVHSSEAYHRLPFGGYAGQCLAPLRRQYVVFTNGVGVILEIDWGGKEGS